MSDPEELDPEVDVDLSDDLDDDEDDVPDGFVVEGVDDDDASDDAGDEDVADDGEDDEGSTRAPEPETIDDADEFADDVAPVVRVPEEEDDAPARRSGEFVCTSCFLVKKESQLAVRSRKVCRDCA